MNDYHPDKPFQVEVTIRFKHLNEYIKSIEEPDERRASIAFVITNLLSQNCDKIESFGLLEMIKSLLSSSNEEDVDYVNPRRFYVV